MNIEKTVPKEASQHKIGFSEKRLCGRDNMTEKRQGKKNNLYDFGEQICKVSK